MNSIDMQVQHFDSIKCSMRPESEWWFNPEPYTGKNRGFVRIPGSQVIACATKEEFRTLLETEYAIWKMKS